MICPQTKEQCRNHVTCQAIEECLHPSGGKLPPKPTMQEIERLVDVFEKAVDAFAVEDYYPPFDAAVSVSRAALMAAIRQLSNSTQGGE